MKVNTDKKLIEKIFDRGIVTEILPSREVLMEKLLSGAKLRIYIGADPTSDALHLSHAKNYMFLEELRSLGHEVIILVGDFTAKIGDPTGRLDARPQLDDGQIRQNVKGWLTQIKPLLHFDSPDNPPKVLYNGDWLAKLSFADVVSLAANFTVQQMLERDMFEKRINNNKPIHLHEFLYPLMQGYDSVAMDVDIELCGTDQIFNALAGRTLLKRIKNKEKLIVALNLMANPKTNELMSKSRGTGVFLSSSPSEMYGAVMAQPDEMIRIMFVNNTRLPLEEIDVILSEGPRAAKGRVALEIVKQFYGQDKAQSAEKDFNETFREGGLPEDIVKVNLKNGDLVDALIADGLVDSKTEWRRLIQDGAVRDENSIKITDLNFKPSRDLILRIGKRRFVKITV